MNTLGTELLAKTDVSTVLAYYFNTLQVDLTRIYKSIALLDISYTRRRWCQLNNVHTVLWRNGVALHETICMLILTETMARCQSCTVITKGQKGPVSLK